MIESDIIRKMFCIWDEMIFLWIILLAILYWIGSYYFFIAAHTPNCFKPRVLMTGYDLCMCIKSAAFWRGSVFLQKINIFMKTKMFFVCP
jgi:hypothetical protein